MQRATMPDAVPMPMRDWVNVGFYGKLPSHGDFLRRRVSDAFVGVWDGWLQECIAASRAELGDRWLDVYLTSPAWRFACAAGACGRTAVLGLMVPSVDRVGRYFPLTIVAELPEEASLFAAAAAARAFFDEAERLVIDTLEAEQIDFDRFDARLSDLGRGPGTPGDPPAIVLEPDAAAVLGGDGRTHWHVPIGGDSDLSPAFERLLSLHLGSLYNPLVLWWTGGSAMVEPSCLVSSGLPHPDSFAALLDGSFARRQWRSVPARIPAPEVADTLVDEVKAPSFRSAAATDAGRVRDTNQDAYLERPDIGIWAVADGLGGHRNGDVASRMVCDALADLLPQPGFDETVEAARHRIGEVNAHLVRTSGALDGVGPGSTVVALLARGMRCAVLWAGDSRVYRCRGEELRQLTRDHSLVHPDGLAGGPESHAITRAVGAEATLLLDLHQDLVCPGDRFLLCSDGLTRSVPEPQIRRWMAHDDIRAAVQGLIQATLDAGAPDNVTVLIVEACP